MGDLYSRLFKIISCLLASCFLYACQSTSDVQTQAGRYTNSNELLQDQLFTRHTLTTIETPEQIFAINEEMQEFVKQSIATEKDFAGKAKRLIKDIFSSENVGLAYRNNANVTAIETFANKSANCMSLTIMAYVLATEAGLEAQFQDVKVPEYWVRNGELNMLTGHVNLVMKKKRTASNQIVWGSTGVEVDFDPFVNKQNFPTSVIAKNTVTAMYYNNKGGMAIVDRNYALAYQYLRAAAKIDPNYHATWANLGVLYRFSNELELAEKSYRHAIFIEPNSLNTLTNLSVLLDKQGRYEESRIIDSAIIKQRIRNPYYHALLADEAMYKGNAESAIRHYKRGINIDEKVHELHFGLAKAYASAGHYELAKRSVQKAIKLKPNSQINREYVAKLDMLRSHN